MKSIRSNHLFSRSFYQETTRYTVDRKSGELIVASVALPTYTFGAIFQPTGAWIGVHYSRHNRRFCVNPLPCLTFYLTLPGGVNP